MDIDRFENYLLYKKQQLSDMISIIHDDTAKVWFQIELDTTEDIIHHFNIFVKGEISTGLGVKDEE